MKQEADRKIILNGREVKYTIRTGPRLKRLRLTLYERGRMVVACPFFLNQKEVENFLSRKANWILEKIDYFKNRPVPLIIRGGKEDYQKFRGKALKIVGQKISLFNSYYRFKINRISIRNQKTRWGSCSAKGNLNFNWRIVLLPENLCDYIIVHELCHLKQMNHSADFWLLVSLSCPDYLRTKKQLAKIF